MRALSLGLSTLLALSSCDDSVATESSLTDSQSSAWSKLDAADRSCTVVLRNVARAVTRGAYETDCSSGTCFVVWQGVLDIDETLAAEPGEAFVLYRNVDSTIWSQARATQAGGGDVPAGFIRYAFRLSRDTMKAALSATGLSRTQLELAPYWRRANGNRLFDKQRGHGDFENYLLASHNEFTVTDDGVVCRGSRRVAASLGFRTGWLTEQHGALVAGSTITVEYALERLPKCRGTHNGAPFWSTTASVRFSPSGSMFEGPVVAFGRAPAGSPTVNAIPWKVSIPKGSTLAEVWFRNFDGGNACESYDSNAGANYRFEIEPFAPNPVAWLGDLGWSFSRDCIRRDGAEDPAKLDDYVQQRACAFFEIDAYVPGLTDEAAKRPNFILARVQLTRDGASLEPMWLTFTERVGNNYRYRFTVPKAELYYGPKWSTLTYSLQASTDGQTWRSEPLHTIVRDPSFCNPAWGSCGP